MIRVELFSSHDPPKHKKTRGPNGPLVSSHLLPRLKQPGRSPHSLRLFWRLYWAARPPSHLQIAFACLSILFRPHWWRRRVLPPSPVHLSRSFNDDRSIYTRFGATRPLKNDLGGTTIKLSRTIEPFRVTDSANAKLRGFGCLARREVKNSPA